LIVEPRLVAHAHVKPERRVYPDEAAAPDVDAADQESSVLDAVSRKLGLCTDAGAVSYGYQIEAGAERGVQHAIAADPCPHQAVVDAHQWRTGQDPGAGKGLQPSNQPPAQIVAPPQGIRALAIAPDDQPFGGDAQSEHDGPECEHEGHGDEGTANQRARTVQNVIRERRHNN
jgi:hypothetical protein